MNVPNLLLLQSWVKSNSDMLRGPDRGTMKDLVAKVSKDLGCKVSHNSLAEMMRSVGIETKRVSRNHAEKTAHLQAIDRLTAENAQLRRALSKLWAKKFIPEDVQEYVLSGLDEEVKEAIFAGEYEPAR